MTVYRLTSAREVARLTAIAVGDQSGMACPCSRYGRRTDDCAPWAVAAHIAYAEANGGEDNDVESLDYLMGLTVNDSADVAETVVSAWDYLPRGLRQELGGKRSARRLAAE